MVTRELGIVWSTADRADLARIAALARAARARALDVSLFLMDGAVDFAASREIDDLVHDGCDIVACATSCDARRAKPAPGVTLGSQNDHAALVHRAGKLVSFT